MVCARHPLRPRATAQGVAVTAPLKCGCRPADTFCKDARRMQDEIRDAIDRHAVSSPAHVRKALADIAAAERALRDHLRGEVAA